MGKTCLGSCAACVSVVWEPGQVVMFQNGPIIYLSSSGEKALEYQFSDCSSLIYQSMKDGSRFEEK